MSTDDSISNDGCGSEALSQDHEEINGRKQTEDSTISSEDIATGPTGPEEDRISVQSLKEILHTAAEAGRTSVSHKLASSSHYINRNHHVGVQGFSSGRSPLETLATLIEQIQHGGETDPEIWRDCEDRWLQLFQLMENQYRDQILAQREQYLCQIQLVQDEIMALIQVQKRPSAVQHTDGAGDAPLLSPPIGGASGVPAHTPQSGASPRPTPAGEPRLGAGESLEESATLVASSGYGTLSTLGPSPCWGEEACVTEQASMGAEPGQGHLTHNSAHGLSDTVVSEPCLIGQESHQPGPNGKPRSPIPDNTSPSDQQKAPSPQLTSWVQKRRAQGSSPAQGPCSRAGETRHSSRSMQGDTQEEVQSAALSSHSFPIKRSDSLLSEISGVTYWRLDEADLFHRLPDSFDSGAYLLLQDVPLDHTLLDEPKLPTSLRDIYHSKQMGQTKQHDWDSSYNSNASTPQVLTLDPTVHMKPLDRTSGFTSPSHFSGPSSPHQPHASPQRANTITPDSMTLEGPPELGGHDSACPSHSLPTVGVATVQQGRTPFTPHIPRHGTRSTSSQEGDSYALDLTRTSQSADSLDDPVVSSLVRQSLKEKHSRHVADLRAYYESEINTLKEQLALVNLPSDVDLATSNQNLLERCEHLDRALTEASTCIRELENKNILLERQLAEWADRSDTASNMVQALQERLKETNQSSQEKDTALARLQTRLLQLEEALDGANRASTAQDAQMKKDHEVLQELMAEYESLRKDHGQVKDNLVSTENKLFDASLEIDELKSIISKLSLRLNNWSMRTWERPVIQSQPSGTRCYSPPERELTQDPAPDPESLRRQTLTPVMKALLQMEETRGKEGHTPKKAGFRSPTKREMLITPLSAKSSPKRCPAENYSTAFDDFPVCSLHSHTRCDVNVYKGDASSTSQFVRPKHRKRLQFKSKGLKEPVDRAWGCPRRSRGQRNPGWGCKFGLGGAGDWGTSAQVQSLADTERLFDELTQEKQQIEAVLSRIPGAGNRVTLQARLDEVALEKRLEKVNRVLGSIRMTLKRFHVLRSSAHI
ncbi:hypothetical protein AGOR_G00245710 [Albula goreensis]|uniref:M-phase phosphoprotein 9 n=1 Tax=Albula goreensis TaxID=1534307 RepID=A0A8T3CFZ5_9TELE|nr:hypothetical protein AGOR_G00245710 [Albula goreensis]